MLKRRHGKIDETITNCVKELLRSGKSVREILDAGLPIGKTTIYTLRSETAIEQQYEGIYTAKLLCKRIHK